MKIINNFKQNQVSKILVITLILFFISIFCFTAEEITFTKKPEAVKDTDPSEPGVNKYKITFALSKATDVEVAILNSSNKIVRHLAAGVLGGQNPPPVPFVASLSQTIKWDGKDDFGILAVGGPFKVQVRAGMGVKYGRIIGGSPYTGVLSAGAPADSVAVAPDGTLYLKLASLVPALHSYIPWQLRRFDKSGKYEKTIIPYAPSTDPAKTSGFELIKTGTDILTPAQNSPLDIVLFRFGDNIYNKVVDNNVVFIDNESAKLTFFKIDGTNATKTILMRTAPDKLKWAKWLSPQVAFSPDGKYAYYSGVANTPYDGKKPEDTDPNFPQGRIYRQDLTVTNSNPEKFYDMELPNWETTKYWLPSAWDKKTAAAGITVDAKGNIFVCDLVNQEVVEISPEGKKISSAKVPWPDKVLVNSKTGDLYVVSTQVSRGFRPPSILMKVSGRGADAKVEAKLGLTNALGTTLALDESGSEPILWIGGGGELVRVVDKGSALVIDGKSIINPNKDDITFVCYGAVDAEAELIYVTTGMGPVWRYNGDTGEGGLLPIKACDVAIGPDGMIYGWGDDGSYQGQIARYTRDVKPAPIEGLNSHKYGRVYGRYGRGNNAPGMAIDWQGQAYVNCGFNNCHVQVYGKDGKLVEFERKAVYGDDGKKPGGSAIIAYVLDQGGSLRLDPAGNLYVMEIGLPKGFKHPVGFEKDPAYNKCSAMIYKFTPKGGEFKKTPDGWNAEGSVMTYMAPSAPVSGNWNSTMSVCHCMRPRFDVDAYGRIYIPNGITYNLAIRDNADNEIITFGAYGNWDSQGPESKEPKTEFPMGWPILAGASDKYIYIGDGLNHRILRTDKFWKAEATCELK